jgi:tetratricopeptide (TPR) repeat protein
MNRQQRRATGKRGNGSGPAEPQGVQQLFAGALALHQAGRLNEAAAAYRRLIALTPNVPEAHSNLGLILRDQMRPGDAIACFRQALAISPRHLEAQCNLGLTLLAVGRPAEAAACLRKVVDIQPNYRAAAINLGSALKASGEFGKGAAAFETALRRNIDICPAWYGLAHCRAFTQADRPLIARMEAVLADPNCPPAGKSLVGFALGKVYDDLCDYEAAIRHFDEAHRLAGGDKPRFDPADFRAFVDKSIAHFANDTPPSPAASHSEMPVLIVGMPCSGTDFVARILARHPKAGSVGESPFWLQRLDGMIAGLAFGLGEKAAAEAVRDYAAMLAALAPGAERVIDAMPVNFLALGEIHRLFPKARIVHCRRDPVEAALSLYFTRFAGQHEYSHHRADIVAYWRQYQRLMDHWRAVLPADVFSEIDDEALAADREATARRLMEFCGLEWDPACLAAHLDPAGGGKPKRRNDYEPWLGELRELIV